MTITLELPDKTLANVLSAARAQDREAESLIVERLIEWYGDDPIYSIEGSDEEMAAIGESLKAIEEGRVRPFDPEAILRRYGLAG